MAQAHWVPKGSIADILASFAHRSIRFPGRLFTEDTKAAMELAQTYLSSLPGWTDLGGVNYCADLGGDQNHRRPYFPSWDLA